MWSERMTDAGFLIVAVVLGLAAGQMVVSPSRLSMLILGLGLIVLATVWVSENRYGAWRLWAISPFLPLASISSLLALLPIPLMALNVALLWPRIKSHQRWVCLLLGFLMVWVLFVGVLLDPRGPATFQQSVVIATGSLLAIVLIAAAPSIEQVCIVLVFIGGVAALLASRVHGYAQDRSEVVLNLNANGVALLGVTGAIAALVVARSRPRFRWVWWAAAIGSGSTLLSTGSRGALISVLAGVVTLVVGVGSGPAWRRLTRLGGSLTVMAMVAPVLVNWLFIFTGRGERQDNSFDVRRATLRLAADVGLAHPLTGAGMGRLSEISASDPGIGLGLSAHNVFAGMFAELGIITLVTFVVILGVAVLRAAKTNRGGTLPLIVTVVAFGLSIEWFPADRIGPVCMLIVGAALAGPTARDPLSIHTSQPDLQAR